MNAQEQIELIPGYIAEPIRAKKIILFGSYAYGCPDVDSDIDLCVITDLEGRRKIDIMREIRKAISSFFTHPVDILVYEEDEFNERAALKNTIEHKVVCEGKVLYDEANEQLARECAKADPKEEQDFAEGRYEY